MNTSLHSQKIFVTIDNIISMALLKIGLTDSHNTPAIIQYSKDNLQFILADLLNKGVPLFSIKRTVLGLNKNQIEYVLPNTVYDIENSQWRSTNVIGCLPSGGIDSINLIQRADYYAYAETTDFFRMDFDQELAPQLVSTIGLFFFGQNDVTLTIEATYDYGDNWDILDQLPKATYNDGQWVWLEYVKPQKYTGIRVSVANGETLRLRYIYPATLTNCTELPMTPMSRDTYSSYPMKYTPQQPLLYYFNKQINPIYTLWGVPTNYYDWQCVLRVKNQIAAPTLLSSKVEVPIWHQEAIVISLACRLVHIVQGADKTLYPILQQDMANAIANSQAANNDLSPTNIYTKIRGYTL